MTYKETPWRTNLRLKLIEFRQSRIWKSLFPKYPKPVVTPQSFDHAPLNPENNQDNETIHIAVAASWNESASKYAQEGTYPWVEEKSDIKLAEVRTPNGTILQYPQNLSGWEAIIETGLNSQKSILQIAILENGLIIAPKLGYANLGSNLDILLSSFAENIYVKTYGTPIEVYSLYSLRHARGRRLGPPKLKHLQSFL